MSMSAWDRILSVGLVGLAAAVGRELDRDHLQRRLRDVAGHPGRRVDRQRQRRGPRDLRRILRVPARPPPAAWSNTETPVCFTYALKSR
jgi:hypothetical protein